jgi:hypothetical protein
VSSCNLNDLKIVDPLAYVRKRPDFWFTSGEFDAIEMASRLVSEVLILGRQRFLFMLSMDGPLFLARPIGSKPRKVGGSFSKSCHFAAWPIRTIGKLP